MAVLPGPLAMSPAFMLPVISLEILLLNAAPAAMFLILAMVWLVYAYLGDSATIRTLLHLRLVTGLAKIIIAVSVFVTCTVHIPTLDSTKALILLAYVVLFLAGLADLYYCRSTDHNSPTSTEIPFVISLLLLVLATTLVPSFESTSTVQVILLCVLIAVCLLQSIVSYLCRHVRILLYACLGSWLIHEAILLQIPHRRTGREVFNPVHAVCHLGLWSFFLLVFRSYVVCCKRRRFPLSDGYDVIESSEEDDQLASPLPVADEHPFDMDKHPHSSQPIPVPKPLRWDSYYWPSYPVGCSVNSSRRVDAQLNIMY